VILLVAMIGAIVLTLKHRQGVKRQNVGLQMARTVASGMRIVSIKSGEGIDE
jgi:NADH-quinone oxidoreductase subunit J